MSDRIREVSDWNRKIIEEFRANEGRVAAFARQPLLLLTHMGANALSDAEKDKVLANLIV